jgi:hypothetical protein
VLNASELVLSDTYGFFGRIVTVGELAARKSVTSSNEARGEETVMTVVALSA